MELSYGMGAVLLGIVIAAVLLYSRRRGWWQRTITDTGTREVYRQEEQRRVKKGEV